MSQRTSNGEWTIGRLLTWTRQWLAEQGVEEPRLSAELLLAHALGCAKIELYTRFDAVPAADLLTTYRDLVRRAGLHEPVAYLLGRKEFYSLEFAVTPAVLIPRPETETLVQAVIERCGECNGRAPRVLDLGTGSGCIAVSVARYVPEATVVATDVSADALAVAASNVARHELSERVRLVEADWLALPADVATGDGFDVIVSNPPYVSEADSASLSRTVREHEPRVALMSDADGLGAFRRLAAGAHAVMAPGGVLLVEIGCDQASAVRETFGRTGRYRFVGARQDQARIDRVLEFSLGDG